MNQSYEYIDGKVILKDRNGNSYATANTDNMPEIVKQENKIEIVDNYIAEYQNKLAENEHSVKKYGKARKDAIGFCLIIPIVFSLMFYIFDTINFTNSNPEMANQFIVNIMNFFNAESYAAYDGITVFLAACIISLPYATIVSISTKIQEKKAIKSLNNNRIGYSKIIEYLKTKKDEEEKKLEELKSQSKIPTNQEKIYKVIDVDNSLDYKKLNLEVENVYNQSLEREKTLTRVRKL